MPHFDDISANYKDSLRDTKDIRKMDSILDYPTQGPLNGHTFNEIQVYHEGGRYSSQIGKCIWTYDAATDTVHFLGFYEEHEEARFYKLIDGTPNAPKKIPF